MVDLRINETLQIPPVPIHRGFIGTGGTKKREQAGSKPGCESVYLFLVFTIVC